MYVTPEIVRAEMDYRVERARREAAPVPAAGRARRTWFRRPHDHSGDHSGAVRRTTVNGPPRAA